MDNLTHSLVGLTAAKAGLEKLSPGATTLCILAANAPDVDIVVLLFKGRWAFLQQHRGVSHSIFGAATLAITLPLVFFIGDRLISKFRKQNPRTKLKGLMLVSILATATHPLLDWTNNYGVRFLLPWNPRWFYGDFVFIVDPFIWMVLGGACFLLTSKSKNQRLVWFFLALIPTYLVLVRAAGENSLANGLLLRLLWIGALIVLVFLYRRRTAATPNARIAMAALAAVSIYCAALGGAHLIALRQAKLHAVAIANSHTEGIVKLAAMPTLANPTEWLCVMETDRATYRFSLSLLQAGAEPSSFVRFEKPTGLTAAAVEQAAHDNRARVFLGFARFPVAELVGEDCATQTLVQFADLRYTEPGKGRGTFSLDVPIECPVLNALNNE